MKRVEKTLLIICLGWIVGISMSLPLWRSNRNFPISPIHDSLNQIPYYIHDILSIILLSSLLIQCFFLLKKGINQKVVISILIASFLLCLLDQSRWQPWVYMYIFMIIPYTMIPKISPKKRYKYVLNIQMIILVAMYFWSGVHKLNVDFINEIANSFFIDFLGIDKNITSNFKILIFIIPLIEISIGIGLTCKPIRKKILPLAIITHIVILIFLSPLVLNQNSIVYPWNIVLIFLVILLFFNNNHSISLKATDKKLAKILSTLIMILFLLMPSLNLSNKWDSYLSFSLYSKKISNLYIAISEKEAKKLKGEFAPFFINLPNIEGGKIIDVNKWSFSAMNVPIYPEDRIYKNISQSFCRDNKLNKEVVFLVLRNNEVLLNWNCPN